MSEGEGEVGRKTAAATEETAMRKRHLHRVNIMIEVIKEIAEEIRNSRDYTRAEKTVAIVDYGKLLAAAERTKAKLLA